MEEKFCYNMTEEMKDKTKEIIENSFNDKIKKSNETKASYNIRQLAETYSEISWNALYIASNYKSCSYSRNGTIFSCYFKKHFIIIDISDNQYSQDYSKESN